MTTRLGLLDSVAIAATKPKEYDRLVSQRTGKTIGYIFIFTIVLTLLSYIYVLRESLPEFDKVAEIAKEINVDASITDGKLVINEAYTYDGDGIYISIDPEKVFYTEDDIPEDCNIALLFGESVMTMYVSGVMQNLSYDSLDGLTINEETIDYFLDLYNAGIKAASILSVLAMYIYTSAVYFGWGAVIGAFGLLFCNMKQYKVDFRAMFIMGLYARMIPSLADAVDAAAGYVIPAGIMEYIVLAGSVVYMYFAVNAYMNKVPSGTNSKTNVVL